MTAEETAESPLQANAARIERLLDEVHAVAGPVAWPRIEALVAELMSLHGEGLAALLEHAMAQADSPIVERIADDPRVSGLLVLHGLHPLSAEGRVERELRRLQPSLREQGVSLELVGIEAGSVRLRASGEVATRGSLLRRAASLAAELAGSDIERVDVIGLTAPSGLIGAERLVRRVQP